MPSESLPPVEGSGQAPEDPSAIGADDALLRRIPPWHQPVRYQSTVDGDIKLRPPSDAFALESGEDGLSFHLENSLRAAGEPITYGCPEGVSGWAVARICAGKLLEFGLTIERDGKPHHVQVFGMRNVGSNARRRLQQKIAKASDYIVYPIPS